MRVIVFFDLPMDTYAEKREYSKFRKYLIRNGFMMLQKSVYCKLALNGTAAGAIISNVRKNKPAHGLVQMMVITEKQYQRMEFVIGEVVSNVIDSTERLIIL